MFGLQLGEKVWWYAVWTTKSGLKSFSCSRFVKCVKILFTCTDRNEGYMWAVDLYCWLHVTYIATVPSDLYTVGPKNCTPFYILTNFVKSAVAVERTQPTEIAPPTVSKYFVSTSEATSGIQPPISRKVLLW